MARIRSIKPEFWTDGKIVQLSFAARLFFIGTWNFARCNEGHLDDDALGLKLKILPADVVDADAVLQELIDAGLIRRDVVAGRSFLTIVRLKEHQKIDQRWDARCPFCQLPEAGLPPPSPAEPQPNSSEHSEPQPNSPNLPVGREGKGKEGKGVVHSLGPETKNGTASKEPRRKRKTPVPEDWQPTSELREWAEGRFRAVRLDADLQAEKFVNYWRAQGELKADWNRAWRNWMIKAEEIELGHRRKEPQVNYEPL